MSLELRKGSRKFFARLVVNGERKCVPLETTYDGHPPAGLRIANKGDRAFEASRGVALAEEAELKKSLQNPGNKLHALRRVYELQSQDALYLGISDLYELDQKAVRNRPPAQRHMADKRRLLQEFEAFLARSYPEVRWAHEVTREMAESFIQERRESNRYSGKTVNNHKGMLRSIFGTAMRKEYLLKNPFSGIPNVEELSEHHRPFTLDQLRGF